VTFERVALVLFVVGCWGMIRWLKASGRLDAILAEFRGGGDR
jgi:hypothetical protein